MKSNSAPLIRSNYTPRPLVQIDCSEPVLTQQHFKNDCDIDQILAKYARTGTFDHLASRNGDYSDLLDATDFHDCMNRVIEAQEVFNSIPAHVRARFQNDPAQFLEFVSNPANRNEMVRMGLMAEGVQEVNTEAEKKSSADADDKGVSPPGETPPTSST